MVMKIRSTFGPTPYGEIGCTVEVDGTEMTDLLAGGGGRAVSASFQTIGEARAWEATTRSSIKARMARLRVGIDRTVLDEDV